MKRTGLRTCRIHACRASGAALNSLAAAAPEWLVSVADPEWYDRYAKRIEDYRLPQSKEERKELAETIGRNGKMLLDAVYSADAPFWLSQIPAVETLRQIWLHQYYIIEGELKLRETKDLPPASCGRNEENVKREAARYGYEEYCTDWNELVNDDRIEVFDNCGPDDVHTEPCIAALKNGKNVICEKPFALSVDDAKRMRDEANLAKGKAMCVFNYRFVPAVRWAKDLISEGRLGQIYHLRVNYLQMAGHDPSTPPHEVWYSGRSHSGIIQGIGSHAIDQCRFLLGEIKSVSALVRTFNEARAIPTIGCEDAVADDGNAALFEFENGAIGVTESSGVATGRKNFLSWEINGSKGSLKWDLEHPNSLFACIEGLGDNSLLGFTEISVTENEHPYVSEWWPQGHNLGWEHCHIIEKFHFLDAVANNKEMSPYIATFEDGYRVAVIIDAMRKSSQSGQRIELRF